MTSEPNITVSDLRRLGICASGQRRWFAEYGLDFKAFLRDVIDPESLLATGDAMAIKAVSNVRSSRGQ